MSNIACGFAFWSAMGIHGTLSVYLYLFSFSNKKVWTQSQVWIFRIGPKIGMENKVSGGEIGQDLEILAVPQLTKQGMWSRPL